MSTSEVVEQRGMSRDMVVHYRDEGIAPILSFGTISERSSLSEHEMNISYDLDKGRFYGDEIAYGEWIDMPAEKVDEVVERYGLVEDVVAYIETYLTAYDYHEDEDEFTMRITLPLDAEPPIFAPEWFELVDFPDGFTVELAANIWGESGIIKDESGDDVIYFYSCGSVYGYGGDIDIEKRHEPDEIARLVSNAIAIRYPNVLPKEVLHTIPMPESKTQARAKADLNADCARKPTPHTREASTASRSKQAI